jgi:hypothetical protein
VDEHQRERVEVDGLELHVDPEPDGSSAIHTALPPKVESWRRRSAMGAILTGFALGLREALEPERDEPGIVAQVSGEPVGDLPVQAHLDDVSPRESVVTIRPWLLDDRPAARGGDGSGEGPAHASPATDR